ncbi:hypothetical protein Nepgr_024076 [Nepenthes gracilis]|uniref:Uncharacterized protein n=1 Tax=Nepenthes gracilis TaxID=150966 RepID=A0AAD3T243_NEPGR|nr:hypothetical protein Nepgr_024076 [Nepenthes gracilis]
MSTAAVLLRRSVYRYRLCQIWHRSPIILSSPYCASSSFHSSRFIGRLFSSKSRSSPQNPSPVETKSNPPCNEDAPDNIEDVSTQELRRRIMKYSEGDMEALPSIFEAILARKLTGNHSDSDDELMEELGSKNSLDVEDDKFDTDDELMQELQCKPPRDVKLDNDGELIEAFQCKMPCDVKTEEDRIRAR